jgi:hypothetical protein
MKRDDNDDEGDATAAFRLANGHATEVALSALADAQDDVVPADVRAHVDTCDACAKKLGALAREAARADVLLPHASPVRASARDDARVPWRIVALGLGVAMAGAALDASGTEGQSGLAGVPKLVHSAPTFFKLVLGAIARAATAHGEALGMVSVCASLAMCLLTVAVARKRFSFTKVQS